MDPIEVSLLQGVPLVAAGWLEGGWQRAIHTYKYRGRSQLAVPLAGQLEGAIGPTSIRLAGLTFVPLHPARQRARGFNQAERLAWALARRLHLPLHPGLVRDRDTPPQVGRDEAQRRRNVAGAFRWTAALPPATGLALIDDVCTTGATLRSAAEAIERAGGRLSAFLVLAVAPVQTLPGDLVTSGGRTGLIQRPVQRESN